MKGPGEPKWLGSGVVSTSKELNKDLLKGESDSLLKPCNRNTSSFT